MNPWSEAIGFEPDENGQPSIATIVEHIRNAVIEAGFVSRGRMTSGLKESYRPLRVDEGLVAQRMDQALDVLTKTGDFIELTTATGRAYAPSQARRVIISEDRHVLLGAANHGDYSGIVRRGPSSAVSAEPIPVRTLDAEIGLAEWRLALVELGGSDSSEDGAASLYDFARALASSGEYLRLADADIAVLSGRGDFFGSFDKLPSGRWQNPGAAGSFPAAIRKQYGASFVVLNSEGSHGSIWQPQSRDLWRWAALGFTLSVGDPIYRFDQQTRIVKFLVPLPRQLERLMLLSARLETTWSWVVTDATIRVLENLVGKPRVLT